MFSRFCNFSVPANKCIWRKNLQYTVLYRSRGGVVERELFVMYFYVKWNRDCTVRYNDFSKLVLPGLWWLQNLILRRIYKKNVFFVFLSRFVRVLTSKFANNASLIFQKFQTQCGYQKTLNLMLILNPSKKLQNNSCEKVINEKVTEK